MSRPNRPESIANRQLAWQRIEAALDFAMDLGELSLESFQSLQPILRSALHLDDHDDEVHDAETEAWLDAREDRISEGHCN